MYYSIKYHLTTLSILLLTLVSTYAQLDPSTVVVKENNLANTEAISHSIFLIGDVGVDFKSPTNSTLQLLKNHLGNADKNSSVLFLGNNVGSNGMASKSHEKEREKDEKTLDAQLEILKNYEGDIIFMPGNRDWKKYGLKGLKRQEKYIEKKLNKSIDDDDLWANNFLPDHGCPGPEVVEINDKLVIIIIDSHWWLMDWDDNPNLNSGCEVKSRETFELLLAATIKDHKNKNIVFASHHPFKSNGPHGGRFSLKNHIFPFTTASDNAYIPLPVIGTAYLFLRQAGIFKQDISNSHYQEFKRMVMKAATGNGEIIFASGHDNSLQYFQDQQHHYVVSGSGSNKTATKTKKDALFTYGSQGFSKIDFYEDGSSWVEFWTPSLTDENGEMVFRKQMKGPLPIKEIQNLAVDFSEFENLKDSINTFPTTTNLNDLGKFTSFMLGERYRELYRKEYNFPMLDLSTFQGGLKVIKKGGGKQTNSLRLVNPDGHEYVMRSLTKDLTRGVPYPFNQLPIVNFLFSENYLGSHPFAPLTLAPLADAANVYHTNPGIYYVPKQPVLGNYNDGFGGEVYLVEERASKSWEDAPFFGNAEKFISTTKLNSKREKNHKHQVDQNWVVRTRLFDMVIGDFDRHADQWRWTVNKKDNGEITYRPVPRDRDQAYSNFDGYIMKLLGPYHALLRQLGTYNEDVGNPKWNYYNTRHFDQHFTNEMTLDDWKKEAAYLQENITDEIIKEAVALLPPKANQLSGEKIEQILKYRRDNLQEIATDFYKKLAKKSILHGTNDHDYFEVIRIDDEHTEVSMYDSNKSGEKKKRIFQRVYKTSETKELIIYGLEDNDFFHVSGSVKKSIKLHLVGGPGKDTFIDESKVGGLGKKDKIYDTKKKNVLKLGTEGKNRTSKVAKNNIFEYLGNQFDENTFIPFPLIGWNSGDGVKVGFSGSYHVQKFNKHPLGSLHKFKLNYGFATNGIQFIYNGIKFEANNNWDFVLNTELRGSRYAYNFFGLGNESEENMNDIDFYRVEQSLLHLDLGFQRRFAGDIGNLSIRPLVQRTDISDNENRFIIQDNNGLTPEDFETRWYGGGIIDLTFSNADNPISPRDGFVFSNSFNWQTSLTGSDREFSKWKTDFKFYKSIGKSKRTVFATRLGASTIRGNYDFFFAPTLGQEENVRGFFSQRFRGKTIFFHTTDLRMGLASVKNSFLPFSVGITGSFDYGRVFEPSEDSDKWHSSAGGGIWLAPLNILVVGVSYNKAINEEGGRIKLSLGHEF
ncbi:MAG: BamA/TamA family outer membrane protein [Saprospiraceae bacterium]